jgi:hypothetical protein
LATAATNELGSTFTDSFPAETRTFVSRLVQQNVFTRRYRLAQSLTF